MYGGMFAGPGGDAAAGSGAADPGDAQGDAQGDARASSWLGGMFRSWTLW